MRGTSHLLMTSLIGLVISAVLFRHMFTESPILAVAFCTSFMWFCAIGSIAPDIDSKRALIKSWYLFGFWRLYWLVGYVPLAAIWGTGHRGVMHSLYGLCWSVIVVYCVTWAIVVQDVARFAAFGFFIGYLSHLIEDQLFTKTSIQWLMHSV